METIKQTFFNKEKNETIKIIYDDNVDTPRDWDNQTHIICFHNKYNFPNETNYNQNDFESFEEIKKTILKDYDVKAILPIYLYDHSGITIKTTPFSCKWDSGQIGFIFITHKQFKEFGNDNAENILIGQIEAYNQYLTGEIFRFEHYKNKKCECCEHEKQELIDSCGGFFGDDIETNGIKEYIDFNGFTEVQ